MLRDFFAGFNLLRLLFSFLRSEKKKTKKKQSATDNIHISEKIYVKFYATIACPEQEVDYGN